MLFNYNDQMSVLRNSYLNKEKEIVEECFCRKENCTCVKFDRVNGTESKKAARYMNCMIYK